ncbi:MAG: PhoH family protein, partial [Synechococcaceae cyanobacterium SM2_3_60]|nr:PhoH family protein [Synechococcaceae cyanobacterium SM2_3_60]
VELLKPLWQFGSAVGLSDIDQAARSLADPEPYVTAQAKVIATSRRGESIRARTPRQATYIQAIQAHELTFGLGPAGTGKTYLAAVMAVQALLQKQCDRIILTRPALEAGEKLGFLPGDLQAKIDPYLRPLYDALYEFIDSERLARLLEQGVIEVAPLAYMRGRTLNNAFVILDEAQNTTPEQMKMFLTRMGSRSRVVVTGDLSQSDLGPRQSSGLAVATQVLSGVDGIYFCRFEAEDVVRHPLVQKIVSAYAAFEVRDTP